MVVPIIVREVMQTPVETVAADAPLDELAARFQAMGHGALVVLREGAPVGIITRMDVIGSLTDGDPVPKITAERIMSRPVITVAESAPIQMGAETLYEHDVNQALVMEGEDVVGCSARTTSRRICPTAPWHSRRRRPRHAPGGQWHRLCSVPQAQNGRRPAPRNCDRDQLHGPARAAARSQFIRTRSTCHPLT